MHRFMSMYRTKMVLYNIEDNRKIMFTNKPSSLENSNNHFGGLKLEWPEHVKNLFKMKVKSSPFQKNPCM